MEAPGDGGDAAIDSGAKKESAVLSDTSLCCLGKELGPIALKICMYLNVPTLTLIQMQTTAETKKWSEEELGSHMLLAWKRQRDGAKDKEKVSDLDRALRDNDKPEQADIVTEKNKENVELTADCFR